jgi:hypothetical protein
VGSSQDKTTTLLDVSDLTPAWVLMTCRLALPPWAVVDLPIARMLPALQAMH